VTFRSVHLCHPHPTCSGTSLKPRSGMLPNTLIARTTEPGWEEAQAPER